MKQNSHLLRAPTVGGSSPRRAAHLITLDLVDDRLADGVVFQARTLLRAQKLPSREVIEARPRSRPARSLEQYPGLGHAADSTRLPGPNGRLERRLERLILAPPTSSNVALECRKQCGTTSGHNAFKPITSPKSKRRVPDEARAASRVRVRLRLCLPTALASVVKAMTPGHFHLRAEDASDQHSTPRTLPCSDRFPSRREVELERVALRLIPLFSTMPPRVC